jgi:uncharacterized protein DUF3800
VRGNPSYIVYIDESGDDGFTFPGSSEWFVLSAAIVSYQYHRVVLERLQQDLSKAGWKAGGSLHFRRLKHGPRVFLANQVAALPLTATSVLVHKRSLRGEFQTSKRLYNYAVRLLLERVSWFCRDNPKDGGDGSASVIFDHRTHGSHLAIREYVDYLRALSTQISWPVIKTEQIEARSPMDRICLHLADIVAGGLREALEPSRFGHTEHRFAKIFQPVIYQRNSHYNAYGLKFFPQAPAGFRWLEKYYGIK